MFKSFFVKVSAGLASIFGLLSPVVGGINGALVPAELRKAALAALGVSTVPGMIAAALTVLAGDTGAIFANATVASLASFILLQAAFQVGQMGLGAKVESVSFPPGFKFALPPGSLHVVRDDGPVGKVGAPIPLEAVVFELGGQVDAVAKRLDEHIMICPCRVARPVPVAQIHPVYGAYYLQPVAGRDPYPVFLEPKGEGRWELDGKPPLK